VYERALLPIKMDFLYETRVYENDTIDLARRKGFVFERWPMKKTDISDGELVSQFFLEEVVRNNKIISGDEALTLLRMIANRELQTYNDEVDLLIFDHPMKTGGTSISDTLKNVFPEQVIPGSDRSGHFQQQTAQKAFKMAIQNKTHEQWLRKQKVVYSHSTFYDLHERASNLRIFLQSIFPSSRRFRILTMVSELIVLPA
jgi:hypothetical protein